MRPLRLSMTAFGPYPGTEVVDFDALADLGLFAVAGRNGAGKTTIFDGLHFALYGVLPGRRATYQRLRSDHAPADAICCVELDFVAGGSQWRVERLPRQQRAKRRGSGVTETQQQATLARVVDGVAVTEHNRINEVNAACRELVGLNGPQFERVTLLPQGEFSRVLRESSTQRRDLLRALFASDVFAETTRQLVDDANLALRNVDVESARFDERLQSIHERVTALCAHEMTADAVSIAEAIDEHDASLVPLERTVDGLREHATAGGIAVQQAVDTIARIDQRDEVRRSLDVHLQAASTMARDIERLRAARAAVPVTNAYSVVQRHDAAQRSIDDRIAHLQHRATPLLCGLTDAAPRNLEQLDQLTDAVAAEITELTAVAEAHDRIERLQAELAALESDRARLDETRRSSARQRDRLDAQRVKLREQRRQLEAEPTVEAATEQHRQLVQRLEQRVELQRLDHQLDELRRADRLATEARQRIDAQLDEAAAARRELPACNDQARHTADELAQLVERRDALRSFHGVRAALGERRRELDAAQRHSDAVFDRFIRGTSARLAEHLTDGSPCSVCGSPTHPEPATTSTEPTTERDLTIARAAVDELRARCARQEQQIEELIGAHDALATEQPETLDERIELATSAAVGTENTANEMARRAASFDTLRDELAALEQQAHSNRAALAEVTERHNQLIGSLGADARQSVDTLSLAVQTATKALEAARTATERGVRLDQRLDETAATLETIDMALLDLTNQRAACDAAHLARSHDLEGLIEIGGRSTARDPRDKLARLHQLDAVLVDLRSALGERRYATDALRSAARALEQRLAAAPFGSTAEAESAALDPSVIASLDASTAAWTTRRDQIQGQLVALGTVPDIKPDVEALRQTAVEAERRWHEQHQSLVRQREACAQLRVEITEFADQRALADTKQQSIDRLVRVADLVKGDNDLNLSLENWVLAAHLRDVVALANIRLARSTAQRFRLCVLDDGESRRGRWGLDLAVEDTVTGTRRPTAGLSGGELFQASLALALGLADAVMNQRAGVHIDALFVDEGFGSLDDTAVERVIDLLDDVRSRGATVGVITHVNALLEALPRGISVIERADGKGSTIEQPKRAA